MNNKKTKVYELNNKMVEFADKYMYSKDMTINDKFFLLVLDLLTIGTALLLPPVFIVGHAKLGFIVAAILALFIAQLIIISKTRRYKVYEVITCVVYMLTFPPAFFYSGGLYGGGLFLFIISVIISYLVLEGVMRVILLLANAIVMITTVLVSVKYPQMVLGGRVPSPEEMSLINIISCILCCFVVISILSFQLYLHRKQELILERSREEAHQASVAKSMFLANMSHEIRTPMGVVIGLSQMIQSEDNINVVHDMAKNINRTSGLLLNIINDILDFEKVSKGMMEIVDSVYSINEIIGDFRNMSEARCAMKGISFSVKTTDSLPEYLLGDETRFRQIGTNIINNAIKYTDKGYIDVILDYNEAKEMLLLVVKDSGKGIKEEDLPYIFDSFQRVDVVKNKHIEGTGLGLSISKKLALAMNGSISVSSEYGKGSIFTVEVAHKKAEKTQAECETIDTDNNFEGISILYVDDTKVNTLIFNGMLKDTKAKCTFKFSGQEALEDIVNSEYDIIFLDYLMPGMDGIELFNRMREMGVTCPIIVLTADAVNNAKERFMSVGFTDFMTKPIQRPALVGAISKYVKKAD